MFVLILALVVFRQKQEPSQKCSIPCALQMKFSHDSFGMERNYCKRVTEASHHSSENFVDSSHYISEILEKEVNPPFSRAATSTDLIATKQLWWMFLAGRCSCTHISKPPITWLKNNIGHYIEKKDWPLKFTRFISDWRCLEHYGCSCLCQSRVSPKWWHSNVSLGDFWPLCKIS